MIPRTCMVALLTAFASASIGHSAARAQRVEGIYRQHLQEYIQWLDLDEDQARLARVFYDDYERAYDAEFLPRTRAYTSRIPGILDPGYMEARHALAEERRAIDEEMQRRDEAFFSALESLLRPEQLERMKRVRYARQRQVWRTDRSELPEGNVDLSALLIRLELNEDEERAAFEVLDWYEPQLVGLLIDRWNSRVATSPLVQELNEVHRRWEEVVTTRSDDAIATRAIADELSAQEAELARRLDEMRKGPRMRLVNLNRAAFAQLLERLTEVNRRELTRLYNEEAYPEVYPDPMNAIVLYDAALKIETLGEIQREQVAAARADFERQHERLSTILAKAFFERRETGNLDEALIFKPGLEREALNAKQIHTLRAILLPEQHEHLPEWDFEKNPAVRPWDWANRIRRAEGDRRRREELQKKADEHQKRGGRGGRTPM